MIWGYGNRPRPHQLRLHSDPPGRPASNLNIQYPFRVQTSSALQIRVTPQVRHRFTRFLRLQCSGYR